jgi:hypothetical protein
MMAAGTAHEGAREHSTVTRSDQAELRRDEVRNRGPLKRIPVVSLNGGRLLAGEMVAEKTESAPPG